MFSVDKSETVVTARVASVEMPIEDFVANRKCRVSLRTNAAGGR